jgi:hypothetical protein
VIDGGDEPSKPIVRRRGEFGAVGGPAADEAHRHTALTGLVERVRERIAAG